MNGSSAPPDPTPSPPEPDIEDPALRDLIAEHLGRATGEAPADIVDEVARTLCEVCENRDGNPDYLRRCVQRKLLRLRTEGYRTGQIVDFLLEDAEELVDESRELAARSARSETPRRRNEPQSSKNRPSKSDQGAEDGGKKRRRRKQMCKEWQQTLEALKGKVHPSTVSYLADIVRHAESAEKSAGRLILRPSDPFEAAHIQENYADIVEASAKEVLGKNVRFVLEGTPDFETDEAA